MVTYFPSLKGKDSVPKDQARGVIYSIPCKVCDKLYIGETKRQFNTRLRRTPKSGRTKTSQEICTRRKLFTIWSHYLVGIVYNITCQLKLANPTPFAGSWKHGKSTRAKIHSIAMTACSSPRSTGPWLYWTKTNSLKYSVFSSNYANLSLRLYFYYPWRRLMQVAETLGH